jgi:hypothetical protein
MELQWDGLTNSHPHCVLVQKWKPSSAVNARVVTLMAVSGRR